MSARLLTIMGSPQAVLTVAILCWSGNFVVGRYANLDVPPVALSFWRHLLATALVLPMVVPVWRRDWPVVRGHLVMFAALAGLFVAGNTFVYIAILHTSVVNAALINAGVPVFAAAFSWMILRDLIHRWQALGVLLAFLGIVIVVTRGDIGVLTGLEFGWGDILMLGAVAAWALYMVLFKRAGVSVSAWTLLFVLSLGGTLWLIPFYVIEAVSGQTMEWTWLTLGSLLYTALVTTIIGWACWNSGLIRIGPNRAASFMCLHPIFGAALGMIFFAETLAGFHLVGTVLTLIGVYLVSRLYAGQH